MATTESLLSKIKHPLVRSIFRESPSINLTETDVQALNARFEQNWEDSYEGFVDALIGVQLSNGQHIPRDWLVVPNGSSWLMTDAVEDCKHKVDFSTKLAKIENNAIRDLLIRRKLDEHLHLIANPDVAISELNNFLRNQPNAALHDILPEINKVLNPFYQLNETLNDANNIHALLDANVVAAENRRIAKLYLIENQKIREALIKRGYALEKATSETINAFNSYLRSAADLNGLLAQLTTMNSNTPLKKLERDHHQNLIPPYKFVDIQLTDVLIANVINEAAIRTESQNSKLAFDKLQTALPSLTAWLEKAENVGYLTLAVNQLSSLTEAEAKRLLNHLSVALANSHNEAEVKAALTQPYEVQEPSAAQKTYKLLPIDAATLTLQPSDSNKISDEVFASHWYQKFIAMLKQAGLVNTGFFKLDEFKKLTPIRIKAKPEELQRLFANVANASTTSALKEALYDFGYSYEKVKELNQYAPNMEVGVAPVGAPINTSIISLQELIEKNKIALQQTDQLENLVENIHLRQLIKEKNIKISTPQVLEKINAGDWLNNDLTILKQNLLKDILLLTNVFVASNVNDDSLRKILEEQERLNSFKDITSFYVKDWLKSSGAPKIEAGQKDLINTWFNEADNKLKQPHEFIGFLKGAPNIGCNFPANFQPDMQALAIRFPYMQTSHKESIRHMISGRCKKDKEILVEQASVFLKEWDKLKDKINANINEVNSNKLNQIIELLTKARQAYINYLEQVERALADNQRDRAYLTKDDQPRLGTIEKRRSLI
jgi:hypothetical protein